jgi:Zn-finger nucleic acid-binding protein
MLAQAIEQAIIDVCDECGGVWADAEDGDIATIATQAHVPEHADEAEAGLATACPRCARRLAPWTAGSVTLDRCGGCGGTFIPRGAIDAAMWLPPDAGDSPPTGLDGLAGWVRRLLGRD